MVSSYISSVLSRLSASTLAGIVSYDYPDKFPYNQWTNVENYIFAEYVWKLPIAMWSNDWTGLTSSDWPSLAKIDPEWEEFLATTTLPPGIKKGDDIVEHRWMLSDWKRGMNAVLLDHLDLDGVEVSETTVPARDDYRIPIRIYKPSTSRPTIPPACPAGEGRAITKGKNGENRAEPEANGELHADDGDAVDGDGGHQTNAVEDFEDDDDYQDPWDPNEQPLIVILHGGGFCLGCLDIEDVNCRSYSKETRATVVNVDYRLAPEHKFPTPVNDCWDVVQWLAKNAYTNPLIRANPTNGFILGGNSAGGNMSAVISTLARDSGLSPPLTGLNLQIPGIMDAKRPPPDYAPEMRSWGQNSDAPVLSTEACEALVAAYQPDLSSRLINLYSEREPVSRAGLPPVFLQVCGLDPLRDEALIFERELRTVHKTPTRLMVYPGLPHGFWGFFPQLKATAKWWRETIEGLRWLLERGWEQRDLRGGAEFTMNM